MALIVMSGCFSMMLALLSPSTTTDVNAFNQLLLSGVQGPLSVLAFGLFTGVAEEVLYRGALQPAFGLWLTSIIFALSHVQYLNPALLLIFLLALALGWIRNRWGTTTAALVHAAYNTILISVTLVAARLADFSG